jgi:hypothetical protein
MMTARTSISPRQRQGSPNGANPIRFSAPLHQLRLSEQLAKPRNKVNAR